MIRSPIKWAGGKTRVMPELLKHLPKADCLIEPFVGSGTVFVNTDYRRYVLCDSNRALINFFLQLRDDTERLIAVPGTCSSTATVKAGITASVTSSILWHGMTRKGIVTRRYGRRLSCT